MATVSIGELYAKLTLKKDSWNSGFKSGEDRLREFIDGSISSMAKWAVRFAAAGAAAFTAITVKTAQFEHEVARTVSVLGGGYDEIAKKAREMGEATIYSASESANAMYNLASAGMSVQETMSAVEPALRFAAAADIGLSQSTAMVAAAIKQFGLEASDATQITDVFTKATQKSMLTAERLQEGMKFLGPAARAVGWSLEEATAALAQFVNLGMEGGLAGRKLVAALGELKKPSDEATKAIEDAGIKLDEINPKYHTLDEIVKRFAESNVDLASVLSRTSEGPMTSLIENFKQGKTGARELTIELEHSAGAAEKAYKQMTDTVKGAWTEFMSAVESMILELGTTWQDEVKGIIRDLTEALRGIIKLIKDNRYELVTFSADMRSNLEEIVRLLNRIKDDLKPIFDDFKISDVSEGITAIIAIMNAGLDTVEVALNRIKKLILYVTRGEWKSVTNTAMGETLDAYFVRKLEEHSKAMGDRAGSRELIKGGSQLTRVSGKQTVQDVENIISALFVSDEPADNVKKTNRELKGTVAVVEEVAKSTKKTAEEAKKTKEEIKEAKDDARFLEQAMNGVLQDAPDIAPLDELFRDTTAKLKEFDYAFTDVVADKARWEMLGEEFESATTEALENMRRNSGSIFDGMGLAITDSLSGGIRDAFGELRNGASAFKSTLFSSVGTSLFQSGLGSLQSSLIGNPNSILGSIGTSIFGGLGDIAGGLFNGLFGSTKEVVSERHDDRTRAEQLQAQVTSARNTIAQTKSQISDMIAQINAGTLNMSADEVQALQAQFAQLEMFDLTDPTVKKSRGSRNLFGERKVRYNLQNEAKVLDQLAAFEEAYGDFTGQVAGIQGTQQFNERTNAFVGSGNQVINNLVNNIGVIIADDASLEEFARRQAKAMVRLGLVQPGIAGV